MTDPHHIALDALVDQLASRVADMVVMKLRTDDFGMVDQIKSPLGRRRHIAFVRAGGGVQIGRRYLARREDIQRHMEELAAGRKPRPEKTMSVADKLRIELGLPPATR
jgi:hypothetical protein